MARFVGRKGKKIFVGLILLVLAVGGLFLSSIGYLPFIGKIKAENKLNAYVQEQGYGVGSLHVQYDLCNDRYDCRLDNGNHLSYRLHNNTIHDEEVNALLNAQLREEYRDIISQFPPNLLFPEHILIWSTVNADNYAEKAERLYLLGIYNTASLTGGQSENLPAAIATDFIARMEDKYNITGIQLIYADRNGMYNIEIRADTFSPLEYEQLMAATKKWPEERLPEDYLEWLRAVR